MSEDANIRRSPVLILNEAEYRLFLRKEFPKHLLGSKSLERSCPAPPAYPAVAVFSFDGRDEKYVIWVTAANFDVNDKETAKWRQLRLLDCPDFDQTEAEYIATKHA